MGGPRQLSVLLSFGGGVYGVYGLFREADLLDEPLIKIPGCP